MQIIFNLIISIFALFFLTSPVKKNGLISVTVEAVSAPIEETSRVLASEKFSLENRYKVKSVNDVFADNILLTLLYMDGDIQKGQVVDWNKVREPGTASFTLNPGETFAFHDNLPQKLDDEVVKTTNAHFNSAEGFKSDGFIVGDGVCHLASFINILASRAGLDVYAPVRHDFAQIPDVSREFGTSINSNGTTQNLMVTNNTATPVTFVFNHNEQSIQITVESA